MIVPQAGPNVQLTGAAPALGPIAEGGGGRNGEKEHASSWEAVLRQLIRWRVIELDLPGGRMKLSSLPGKSLGQAWQIAERILKGNFPAQYQCIVTGPVGPDKTALLRKIEKLLARQGFTPHYVDCSATRLPQDLVELLQALTAQVVVQVNPDPTPDEFGEVYRALQFSHALNRLWILLDNADAWMRLPQGQETRLRLIGKQNVVAAAVMPLHMPEDWQQFTLAAPAVGRRWLARAGAPVSDGESRINHWLASLPSLSSDRLTYWVLCDCVAHDQDSSALAVVTTCRRHLEHWLDPLNLTLAQYLELPYHARSWVELMTMGIELSAEKPIASVARIRQEAGGLFQKHQAGTLDERGRLRLAWLIEHYTGIESEAYRA
jgi:hypothetical protein